MHDHVLSTFAEVGQLVDSNDKLDVLVDDAVDSGLLIDFEAPRLAALDAVDIQLEHGRQLWPEGLRDTIVVEIQDWDLVSVPHYALELFVDLDA